VAAAPATKTAVDGDLAAIVGVDEAEAEAEAEAELEAEVQPIQATTVLKTGKVFPKPNVLKC
jgi:hypothetical protein